jgi:hypothetical protein
VPRGRFRLAVPGPAAGRNDGQPMAPDATAVGPAAAVPAGGTSPAGGAYLPRVMRCQGGVLTRGPFDTRQAR